MTKAYNIALKGVTEKYSEAVTKLSKPGDCVVVTRGLPRSIVMVCPDGCGENITINLDRRTGKAWRKYETSEKLTIYPSVWRDTGCRAHFIVWKDHIIWCGYENNQDVTVSEELISTVLKNILVNNYVHFEVIAEALQEIPWDVLWACKELTRRGRVAEGKNGNFSKF